jgi:hypothetical protein
MTWRLGVTTCLAAWLAAAPLSSHHSVSGQFDGTRPVSLEGVVTRVAWENPHVWIYLDVTERGGRVVNWAIECAPLGIMQRSIDRSLVPNGERVTINAYRARNSDEPLAHAYDLILRDGRRFVIGLKL